LGGALALPLQVFVVGYLLGPYGVGALFLPSFMAIGIGAVLTLFESWLVGRRFRFVGLGALGVIVIFVILVLLVITTGKFNV
jgi:hypothetical protein